MQRVKNPNIIVFHFGSRFRPFWGRVCLGHLLFYGFRGLGISFPNLIFSKVFISEPRFLRCAFFDFLGVRPRLHNRFFFFLVLKFVRPLWFPAAFFGIIFGVHVNLRFGQRCIFDCSDKVGGSRFGEGRCGCVRLNGATQVVALASATVQDYALTTPSPK